MKARVCRLPAFYGQKFQRRLKAGAACEDLRMRCQHYYDVGCVLAERTESPELGPLLQAAFSDRYRVRSCYRLPVQAKLSCAMSALLCCGLCTCGAHQVARGHPAAGCLQRPLWMRQQSAELPESRGSESDYQQNGHTASGVLLTSWAQASWQALSSSHPLRDPACSKG